MKHTVAAIAGLALLSGCATFGGDMILRVSGSVPAGQSDDRGLGCELSMLGESDRVLSSMPVGSAFSVPMMVVAGPEPKGYHFTVQCRDGGRFESNVVQISSQRTYAREFDLGELQAR